MSTPVPARLMRSWTSPSRGRLIETVVDQRCGLSSTDSSVDGSAASFSTDQFIATPGQASPFQRKTAVASRSSC